MLSGAVLKQFRTYLKSQVGNGWSVEGRKSKGRLLTRVSFRYLNIERSEVFIDSGSINAINVPFMFDIYKLNVVSVPTNKDMIRKDTNDQIFRTEEEKNYAILNKVKECNAKGQPVLVGTTSIENSEKMSKIFTKNKLNHNVLNAKQHEKEANIIAEAGKTGMITIATNMAGRGTDIQLGGNKNLFVKMNDNKDKIEEIIIEKEKVKNQGCLLYTSPSPRARTRSRMPSSA